MWTRIYLLLIIVRLYFALSPSYIHPDENFQGPEVIAGRIFGFLNRPPWEYTAVNPVRSAFSLWPAYGLPMIILRWVWPETGKEEVAPAIIYYTLRVVMFMLSFILEDWAIHELVQSPRQRRVAVILVASSYVTWTYQTHTFSNSIETLVVLWSLVLIQRILETKQRSSRLASSLLGFLVVFGVFNRITFPAFIIVPGLYLLPHFKRKPLSLVFLIIAASITILLALLTDAEFYKLYRPSSSFFSLPPTPLSSLLYNLSPSNLALHGTHPPYQHFLANLPLLLLPAFPLLVFSPFPNVSLSFGLPHFSRLPLLSALSATAILSIFSHQEPRFLLPVVPLLLSSIRLPREKIWVRIFITSWILFNVTMGLIMGIYHQGGVVPMQLWLGNNEVLGAQDVLWWKTYSPPVWLVGGKIGEDRLRTTDLMGVPIENLLVVIEDTVGSCHRLEGKGVIVVAPRSRTDLDVWTEGRKGEWDWTEIWTEWRHLNLDDLDWGEDGVMRTLRRAIGRRGLTAWKVTRRCGQG